MVLLDRLSFTQDSIANMQLVGAILEVILTFSLSVDRAAKKPVRIPDSDWPGGVHFSK